MRIKLIGLIIGVLVAPDQLWAQTDNSYGLAENIQARIIGVEADYERVIQTKVRQFRLVRRLETFPPIDGKTVSVPVKISKRDLRNVSRENSPPVIATLHDRRPGGPARQL